MIKISIVILLYLLYSSFIAEAREEKALFTLSDKVSVKRGAPNVATEDEAMALAITGESDAADRCLAVHRKLIEKVNKAEEKALKINVFSSQNGKGLEASRQILKKELTELGHIVYERELNETKGKTSPEVDLNIFFEVINQEWLNYATANWFIPNPECYVQDPILLDQIDLFLCRTHEVERIFNSMNKKTYYLGFSSRDCLSEAIEKDYRLCFHAPGGSPFKGTQAIVKAWSGKSYLADLTILIHYSLPHIRQPNIQWLTERLPLSELRLLQNHCGIHLCPSETEGFGHYLMEAMSTGAVVITTDGPPMNEFIADERCLAPYRDRAHYHLGTCYFVDPEQLAKRIENLMALPIEELKEIGDRNRANYLQKTEEFHENLRLLMLSEFPKDRSSRYRL